MGSPRYFNHSVQGFSKLFYIYFDIYSGKGISTHPYHLWEITVTVKIVEPR